MSWLKEVCGAAAIAALGATLIGCSSYNAVSNEEYYEPEYDYQQEYDPPAPPEPTSVEQPGGGIAWNEAINYSWTYQRVCGPFAGWGNSYDDVFFNLGVDYPNPARFQIVIWDIGWIEPIPNPGTTVCVTGDISVYEGVAQVELYDPGAIELYW